MEDEVPGVYALSARVEDVNIYEVRAGTPARLRVKVGHRQVGRTTLMHAGKLWSPGTRRLERQGEILGEGGRDLRDTVLECTTVVKDVSDTTDQTAVLFTLDGGRGEQAFPYSLRATTPGGYVRYHVAFVFV